MLEIHKCLHADADMVGGVRVRKHDNANKLYAEVQMPDSNGRNFKFLTQNLRKTTSPHTQRVLTAVQHNERLSITWIVAADASGFYGRIMSHTTRADHTVRIEDLIANRVMYDLRTVRR